MKKVLVFSVALACAAMFTACCNKPFSFVSKGNPATLDTLSYSLGVDAGTGWAEGMGDIPFDFQVMAKGIMAGSMEKGKISRDSARRYIQDYFMTKRPARQQADTLMFENEKERRNLSYAVGIDMGGNMNDSNLPVELNWFMEALELCFNKTGEPKIDVASARTYVMNYIYVTGPEKNKRENVEWLEEVEKQPGVQKTASGLLYKVEKAGNTDLMPRDDRDTVKVMYTGWNHHGQIFDSSYFGKKSKREREWLNERMKEDKKSGNKNGYKKNQPAEFPLNGVIKGWGEGLKFVGKGGKITLWIPTELAYGERGANARVPRHEALKFEVKVIDVMPYFDPFAPKPAETQPIENAAQ